MPGKRTSSGTAPSSPIRKKLKEDEVKQENSEPARRRSSRAILKEKEEAEVMNRAPIDDVISGEESESDSGRARGRRKSRGRGIPKKRTRNQKLKSQLGTSGDATASTNSEDGNDDESNQAWFTGDPIPDEEARRRWPMRYEHNNNKKTAGENKNGNDEEKFQEAIRHYMSAEVDGIRYELYDQAYVKAGADEPNYICRIVELFEALDGSSYFRARWFYRASDTKIMQLSDLVKAKRVFLSDVHNDNPLDCLVRKLNIVKVPLNVDLEAEKATIPPCDFYYDTLYLLPYSTFLKVPSDDQIEGNESLSAISSNIEMTEPGSEVITEDGLTSQKSEVRLLDMYSGCGAMSTGLCLGANFGGTNLVTKWAVDINERACNTLRYNHPESQVRNVAAEDFLSLLKEWRKLCMSVGLVKCIDVSQLYANTFTWADGGGKVEKVLDICYEGDTKGDKGRGLCLKVKWKGYKPKEYSWEPISSLSNCGERIKEFIVQGYNTKMLPLPGETDMVCGGPPCQGVSGYNRFRNKEPLADEKNKQLLVFMEVVEFLKPRFVLMENVVDLLKFKKGYLGRYALGRLVQMNYQVRLGMMAAGAYGLPQFRMRVFLWGALPSENLPQYPLPTHNVVVRGVIPTEFENNTVAYDEGYCLDLLEKKLLLEDAIFDLPEIGNYELQDEIPYDKPPQTNFQRLIRLTKEAMMGSSMERFNTILYDHRSLKLNQDDYERVCQIPKKKGANYRDLPEPAIRIVHNKAEWIPNAKRVLLKSGKPLVPCYAVSFIGGTSTKPFGRLWWDETVSTVITRAEPHNQCILHPVQDRVLSIRENARLQGFPDYYKLTGSIKERYTQVGNAVAVPVARALGYALSLAIQGKCDNSPLVKLPPGFSFKFEDRPCSSSDYAANAS